MATLRPQVIHVHPLAAAKPAVGAPCNGCGICCLAEPCPMGMLVTGQRKGACSALHWDPTMAVYRCGIVTGSAPARAASVPSGVLEVWRSMARRWIGAGRGCDCSLEVDAGLDADSAQSAS